MAQKQSKHYKHLSQDEREKIYLWRNQWKSFRWIWKKIWRSHTTVSRERKRNSKDKWWDKFTYSPSEAQKLYEERRANANFGHVKLWRNQRYRCKMIEQLKKKWRERWLDEIMWRMGENWYEKISSSSWYRFVRYDMPELQKYLRFGERWYKTKKKWNKRKQKCLGVPNISERSKEANNREEADHWEWDTVVSWRISKWWVVTMLERISRYYILKKIGNLEAENTKITIEAMMKWERVKSITFDNGVEFSKIWELWYQCYLADPYSSWQRWWNEKSNGLFRVFIPKGSDISKYTNEEIQAIQDKINHKPRKILGYKTPYEVYHNVEMKYL